MAQAVGECITTVAGIDTIGPQAVRQGERASVRRVAIEYGRTVYGYYERVLRAKAGSASPYYVGLSSQMGSFTHVTKRVALRLTGVLRRRVRSLRSIDFVVKHVRAVDLSKAKPLASHASGLWPTIQAFADIKSKRTRGKWHYVWGPQKKASR